MTRGRLVVVFANKQPAAWETLVEALIRAGFVVTGSWPIQTEMINKVAGGARLASSVWIVCRKRAAARPGWDSSVLDEMRATSPGSCATSGTRAFAGRTSCGRPPGRPWKPSADTRL